jgi:ketosteroid isomerase-like protein
MSKGGVEMSSDPSPSNSGPAHVHAVREFFELLHQKDIEAWGELWHEQGRIIVPYPAEGFPTSIEGKAEIVSGFQTMFANFDTFESEITGVYPAADSDAVCVEYRNNATLVGGTVYTNENIAVFRFEDGLIREYHDYFDPRRFQTVVDALPDS